MPALTFRFWYGGLIILGFVIAENVQKRYGWLPKVVVTNFLLEYGRLKCIDAFGVTFKYRKALFLLNWKALLLVVPVPVGIVRRCSVIFIIFLIK